jgi:hypothetical protein
VTEKRWSSLTMRPVAVASTMFWGVLSLSLALLMVTVKPSSNSTSRSLATVMLMVWVVSLAAKDRVPAGAAAEVGGVGGAGAAAGDGPVHRGGLADCTGAGDREGVGGVAALALALSASVATMEKPVSSLVMVALAVVPVRAVLARPVAARC